MVSIRAGEHNHTIRHIVYLYLFTYSPTVQNHHLNRESIKFRPEKGCCGRLDSVGPVIWNLSLRAMEAGIMDRSGYSTTKSGKTLAMVSVLLSILVFVLQILMILGLIAAIGWAGAAGP